MMKDMIARSVLLTLLLGLSGCGGTKLLKETKPREATYLLATASDQHLKVSLDWVIFRDGPGTWAKNVDWDEYLIRVQNIGNDSLEISSISVVDSLGTNVDPRHNRSQLIKGTKEAKRRYKGEGLKVKAGLSGKVLAGTGLFLATGTSSLGAIAMYGSGAALGAAASVVLLAPVLAVGGVVRGVNNSKVNNQIEARQTMLPVRLMSEEERLLDIFFPLSPSPRTIEIVYLNSQESHTLTIDTRTALDGLHLTQASE